MAAIGTDFINSIGTDFINSYVGEDCLRPASRNDGLLSNNPHAKIPEADPRGRGDGRIYGRVLLVLLQVIGFTVRSASFGLCKIGTEFINSLKPNAFITVDSSRRMSNPYRHIPRKWRFESDGRSTVPRGKLRPIDSPPCS